MNIFVLLYYEKEIIFHKNALLNTHLKPLDNFYIFLLMIQKYFSLYLMVKIKGISNM